jgi:hypothetical protein
MFGASEDAGAEDWHVPKDIWRLTSSVPIRSVAINLRIVEGGPTPRGR